MRTLLVILFIAGTLGAQAPEPIKDKDRILVQGLTIQILQTENRIFKLSYQLNELQAQRVKWYSAMPLKYKVNGYTLDAELKWVKKEKPDAITSTNTSP